jgi:hypothetical protein
LLQLDFDVDICVLSWTFCGPPAKYFFALGDLEDLGDLTVSVEFLVERSYLTTRVVFPDSEI